VREVGLGHPWNGSMTAMTDSKPIRVVPDAKYPTMLRLQWADGTLSADMYNLTRANDILRHYDGYLERMRMAGNKRGAGVPRGVAHAFSEAECPYREVVCAAFPPSQAALRRFRADYGSAQPGRLLPERHHNRLSAEQYCRAKAEGVYKGRPASIDVAKVRAMKAKGMGETEIAKALKIGRASVYRALS
jgi:Helix-turn-helix domain of resolvase